MNPEAFQSIAASNQWSGIMPEILVAALALLLLVLEILFPKQKEIIPGVAIMGQVAILVAVIANYHTAWIDAVNFDGLIRHSGPGQFMRVFFLVTSLFVSTLATVALARQKMPKVEFFHIVLVVTGAMMLLAQANNFVLLFVALETVTVGFYILVSYVRTNSLSLEAGLKYLIMGALSSAILLFGIVLVYGTAGNPALAGHASDPMNFGQIQAFLAANPDNFLAKLGAVLVLCGVLFKIGAVPFQIWVPDVYQGAPTPVTAFLAVGSKAAGFALLVILVQVFAPLHAVVLPVLTVVTVATLLFGNLAALTQHNVKRLIGLSGVSHAGFLLLGVIASFKSGLGMGPVYFYLATYLLASFVVFGVMTHCAGENDADQELDHYVDLAKTHPFLAGLLAIGLGSLAGIPPLAGFIGKLLVFMSAFDSGLYGLLAVAIVGVVISIYYYFGWIKAAYFPQWRAPLAEGETDPRPARTPMNYAVGLFLVVAAFASIFLGFIQAPLISALSIG
ncbi:MAG: NADH-quinone oxidoreductase subunit N [Opitutaceae bacterium]|nr:NADH-quinone oxidoreductase subunit N [Opitutaceae bacterium]